MNYDPKAQRIGSAVGMPTVLVGMLGPFVFPVSDARKMFPAASAVAHACRAPAPLSLIDNGPSAQRPPPPHLLRRSIAPARATTPAHGGIAPCRRNLDGVARLAIDNADDLELVASVHDRKMAVPGDPPDADRGNSNPRHASAPVDVHADSPIAARFVVCPLENPRHDH